MPTSKTTTSTPTLETLIGRVDTLEKQIAILLAKNASHELPKKEKKVASDHDKSKTKRVSGYILYSNANRNEVKEQLSDGENKAKNTDIMKKLAENWKALGDAAKEDWNLKAKDIKDPP